MDKRLKQPPKKEYFTPMISVEELLKQDVLTSSSDGENRVFNANEFGNGDFFSAMLGDSAL